MEEVLQDVSDLDEDLLPGVAKSICNLLYDDFKIELLPKSISDDSLLDSIRYPLFVIFESLLIATRNDDSAARERALKLVSEMYVYQPSIGHLLLYFLKVKHRTERKREDHIKISVYKDFCQTVEKKIDNCLYDDLNHISDNSLMMWIVPDLYKDFKQQTVNNAQILRVIVSSIDAQQLQELISLIMQGRLTMFKSDNLQTLLKTSLGWESIEQFFFWQLIQAHDISVDSIIPLVSHLNYQHHAEALTAITLLLKQDKPTSDIIKYLFSRDIRDKCDPFLFTMIKYWCENDLDKLGELISSLLSTRYPATSPNKRKRNKSLSATVPSADQVLGHLDLLRVNCEKNDGLGLYSLDSMQKALVVAQNNSTDSQKKIFNELFSLTEEEDTSTSKSRNQGRGRKPTNKLKRAAREVSDTSEESSEVSVDLLLNCLCCTSV